MPFITDKQLNWLEKEGCSCDLLYGYICGIHAIIKEIKFPKRKEKEIKDIDIYKDFVQPPGYTSDI